MFSDSSHLLSFALMTIFDLLILIVSLSRYLLHHNYRVSLSPSVNKADVLDYTKAKPLDVLQFKNNSDNNFGIYQNLQRTLGNLNRLPHMFQKFTYNKHITLRNKSNISNILRLLKILCVESNIDYHTVYKNYLCDTFTLYHPIFKSSHSIVENYSPL